MKCQSLPIYFDLFDCAECGIVGTKNVFLRGQSKLNKYPKILGKQLQNSRCQGLKTEFSNTLYLQPKAGLDRGSKISNYVF